MAAMDILFTRVNLHNEVHFDILLNNKCSLLTAYSFFSVCSSSFPLLYLFMQKQIWPPRRANVSSHLHHPLHHFTFLPLSSSFPLPSSPLFFPVAITIWTMDWTGLDRADRAEPGPEPTSKRMRINPLIRYELRVNLNQN